ncbi:uncharacterized protein LOC121393799 [Xenopus laevis]|uniref:Uncharacterized protein LOC121393799 n=1 Tax=Xenopus laevis TaxID=8355 RepID=A0A8J1KPK7_XENLA|nr:uncharacterized protein LOC121393799 [Xenopus laevis]
MGTEDPRRRVQARPPLLSNKYLCILRKTQILRSRKELKEHPLRPIAQRNNLRSSPTRFFQRNLLSPLPEKKDERNLQGYPQPQTPQQVSQNKKLQNGDSEVHMPTYRPRGLDGKDRHPGRISPHPNMGNSQKIPEVHDIGQTLPIPSPPVRSCIRPKGLYEDTSTHDSLSETQRHPNLLLPRRYAHKGTITQQAYTTSRDRLKYPETMGMDHQLGEIQSPSNSRNSIPRSPNQLQKTPSKTPRRQSLGHNPPSETTISPSHHNGEDMSTSLGETYIYHRLNKMGQIPYEASPRGLPKKIGQESREGLATDPLRPQHNLSNVLVAQKRKPGNSGILSPPEMGNSHDGRKPHGLGSPLQTNPDPRKMDPFREQEILQLERTEGGFVSHLPPPKTPKGQVHPNQIRQLNHSKLYQQPGGDQVQTVVLLDHSYFRMGTKERDNHQSFLHPGPFELPSGSSQQEVPSYRRMGTEPGCIPHDLQEMGQHIHRPNGNFQEQKEQSVLLMAEGPQDNILGRVLLPMELPPSIHFSSNIHDSENYQENTRGQSTCDPHHTLVAKETLVPSPLPSIPTEAIPSSRHSRPTPSGTNTTSRSRELGPNCLEPERMKLKGLGLSDEAIKTLTASRKISTSSKYYKIWEKFSSWGLGKYGEAFSISEISIIEFLQSGVEASLSTSTLKGQISAISAYTDNQWASRPLIKQFFKALSRLRPQNRDSVPPWDLSLVLDALTRAPFEPLEDVPLEILSLKTTFLLAISSARRVGELHSLSTRESKITFLHDKVILKTRDNFIPKVVSKFHMSQDIILPTFFDNPQNEEENRLHHLDVTRCLKIYLQRVADFRKSDNLLLIHEGSKKGLAASKKTISTWIRDCIQSAYSSQTVPGPTSLRAHSTRGIAASWAFHAQVSADTICRAATWKNLHTFSKHYCFDIFSNDIAEFGRSVLSAATIKAHN